MNRSAFEEPLSGLPNRRARRAWLNHRDQRYLWMAAYRLDRIDARQRRERMRAWLARPFDEAAFLEGATRAGRAWALKMEAAVYDALLAMGPKDTP